MRFEHESDSDPKATGTGPPRTTDRVKGYLTDIRGPVGILAHKRLNHYSMKTLRSAQEKGTLYTGFPLRNENTKHESLCIGCAIGKITRRHRVTQKRNKSVKEKLKRIINKKDIDEPIGKLKAHREIAVWLTVEEILQLVKPYGHEGYLDTVTPYPVAWDGSRHAFVWIDKSTNTQIWLYGPYKSDVQGTVIGKQLKRKLLGTMDPTNMKFYRLGSDRAGELLSNEFHQNVARELGIKDRRTNVPGNSYQNSRAERAIRTTTESVAANMAEKGAPQHLWTYGYEMAAAISDKLPCRSNPNNYSPFQMRYLLATGLKPEPDDVSWFRIPFSSVAYIEERARTERVLGRGKLGILVGMDIGTKGYRVMPVDHKTQRLRPAHTKLVAPKDIYFDEKSKMPTRKESRTIQKELEVVPFLDLTGFERTEPKTTTRNKERTKPKKGENVSEHPQREITPEFEQIDNENEQEGSDEPDGQLEVEIQERPPSPPRVTEAGKILQKLQYYHEHKREEKGVSHREEIREGDHENYDNSKAKLLTSTLPEAPNGLRRSTRVNEARKKKEQEEAHLTEHRKREEAHMAESNKTEALEKERALRKLSDVLEKIVGMTATNQEMRITREDVGKLPKSPAQAQKHKYAEKWKEAMEDQKRKLLGFQCFGPEIPREKLGRGKRILLHKWVFEIETEKIKTKGGAWIEKVLRFKARLVAMGFTQQEGIDYGEVFSPTPAWVSIRLVLALAGQHNMHISVFDISGAFLHAKLEHELYITGLPWMKKGTVSRILAALYGTKQAGRQWYKLLQQHLTELGFKRSMKEPCIMYRVSRKDGKLIVIITVVWVDDGVIASTDRKESEKIINDLRKKLNIRKWVCLDKPGDNTTLLGGTITRTPRGFHLCSTKNVNRLLEILRLKDHIKVTKQRTTPLTPGVKLTETEKCGEKISTETHPYRSGVGSMSHLTNFCFPVIAYARSQLSSSLSEPRTRHWKELLNVAIFLGQNKDLGLLFKYGIDPEYPGVLTRTDSSFRDHGPTQRSTSSHNNFYNGSIIEWNSRRQKKVHTSTAAAETVAADTGVRNGLQVRYLLEEILPSTWIEIMGIHKHELDNKAAWQHITKMKTLEGTKHLPVHYFHMRELVENGELQSSWIATDKNDSDLGTKAVSGPQFEKLLPNVMISLEDAMNKEI